MSLQMLQVMDIQKGHKEERYDPQDRDDVKRIKKLIKEKLDEGWLLFGAKAGEKEMKKIELQDLDSDLDRFVVTPMEKRLLAVPLAGG